MTSKKPSDLARARLAKRTQQQIAIINHITPKALQKTPSQKRSEAGRKRLLRGQKTERVVKEDCTGCPQNPCGKSIKNCDAPVTRYQCKRCGLEVICYRVEPRPEYCVPCGERKSKETTI